MLKRIFTGVVLAGLCFLAVARTTDNEIQITDQEIQSGLSTLQQILEEDYLFPEMAPAVKGAILQGSLSGQLAGPMAAGMLKINLEKLLTSATGDSNFEINVRRNSLDTAEKADFYRYPDKYTIEVEISDDAIGYLALKDNFLSLSALPELQRAIDKLRHCRALILDLRFSGEGNISLIQHLLTYWLPNNTQFAELQFNPNRQPETLTTIAASQTYSPVFDIPTFVVNSGLVLGAWELFGYALQNQKAAVLVGEKTMGLARLTRQVQFSQHMYLTFSHAEAVDPKSGKSWHQKGLLPDYSTKPEEALETAYRLARQAILTKG